MCMFLLGYLYTSVTYNNIYTAHFLYCHLNLIQLIKSPNKIKKEKLVKFSLVKRHQFVINFK